MSKAAAAKCCSGERKSLDPMYVFCDGDPVPNSRKFDIPEGGWAEIHVDALPAGTKLCVMEVICVCGKPDKHIPLVIGGQPSGVAAGCTSFVIPKGGRFYLQYNGADVDFDAVVIPHADVSDLQTIMACGACC